MSWGTTAEVYFSRMNKNIAEDAVESATHGIDRAKSELALLLGIHAGAEAVGNVGGLVYIDEDNNRWPWVEYAQMRLTEIFDSLEDEYSTKARAELLLDSDRIISEE